MKSITLPNGMVLHTYDCIKVTDMLGREEILRVDSIPNDRSFLGIKAEVKYPSRIRNVTGKYYWWRNSNGSGLHQCKIERITVGDVFVHQSLLRKFEGLKELDEILEVTEERRKVYENAN